MKTLDINQMEIIDGGQDVDCGVGILVGALTFGLITGGVGLVAGLIVAGAACL